MAGRGIRLSIVVASLRCGGVERSVATTVAVLSRRGYRVTVVTYDDTRSDFFSLPPEVERIPLGLTSVRPTSLPRLIPKMFRTLSTLRAAVVASAPDVVISHMVKPNVQTLLALGGSRIPIIVTEHGDVAVAEFRKAAWYRLRRACYGSAFRVVSVSDAVDRNVRWLPDDQRAVIANPIVACTRTVEPRPGVRDSIASVGRLSHVKGFDVLISAFGRLAADFPEWRLIIVGGGELREELERQAADLRLGERILFTGALADPTVILRRAKLFAMGSRYEGFPLAHGEALACGLPVVATDCPSRPLAKGERLVPGGVRELVQHDVNGLLVPPEDPDALARAMAALMSDPRRREALARRGPEVLARLSPEKIADEWERLIDQAISGSKPARRARTQRRVQTSRRAPATIERPRIVMTGPVMSAISGISTHVALLASALSDRFTVVHFPIGGEGLNEGVVRRVLRLFIAPIRLAVLLRRRRPELVHINTSLNWRALTRDALIFATCRLSGQRFVLQFHGGRPPQSRSLIERVQRWALLRVLRTPERIVAISREDEVFYAGVAPAAKIVRIANGVGFKETPVAAGSRFNGDQLRLLHFGRLAEDKGLLDVLDALALLDARDVQRISLVVAGTGPLLDRARVRAKSLDLDKRVSFVGAAFGAQKDDLLVNADLFVMPTYHAERLPYALLESMAAGVVPITSRAGAIGDLVRHEREGFIVNPRDPPGLAHILATLLQDPSQLPRMSAKCREIIRSRYSLERMANDFALLYNGVIEGRAEQLPNRDASPTLT